MGLADGTAWEKEEVRELAEHFLEPRITAKKESFREWLVGGGGGHEDGEDGIRACTLPLESAIELVEHYLEYLKRRLASGSRRPESKGDENVRHFNHAGREADTLAQPGP
jgi:hypothetical protein